MTTIYFLLLRFFSSEAPIFVMLAAAACERFTQEIWKAFFRKQQRKNMYIIPQGFHILGEEVQSYPRKLIAGVIVIFGFLALIQKMLPVHIDSYMYRLGIIMIFGSFVSLGGAWKDAPIEGFEIAKFPRSMLVTSIVGALISTQVQSLGVLILASLGLERYCVEFYKTFIVKKTPGKFIEHVNFPIMLENRKIFGATYLIAIVGIALLLLL